MNHEPVSSCRSTCHLHSDCTRFAHGRRFPSSSPQIHWRSQAARTCSLRLGCREYTMVRYLIYPTLFLGEASASKTLHNSWPGGLSTPTCKRNFLFCRLGYWISLHSKRYAHYAVPVKEARECINWKYICLCRLTHGKCNSPVHFSIYFPDFGQILDHLGVIWAWSLVLWDSLWASRATYGACLGRKSKNIPILCEIRVPNELKLGTCWLRFVIL